MLELNVHSRHRAPAQADLGERHAALLLSQCYLFANIEHKHSDNPGGAEPRRSLLSAAQRLRADRLSLKMIKHRGHDEREFR
jgi:hypothetical protein